MINLSIFFMFTGLINKFLSNKIFFPMSRLTYTCYLLNPAIILSLYSISSYPFFIDYVTIVRTIKFKVLLNNIKVMLMKIILIFLIFFQAGIFLVAVLFSYIAAIILSASAEAPFIMLLRLIIQSKNKETK